MLSVGIDLGASAIHVVGLRSPDGGRPQVAVARTFDATDRDGVVALTRTARDIAIDAPAQLSTAPHRADESISPKFRTARCGEIALGQQAGIWVPWVTPHDAAKVAGWMQVGFGLWAALRAAGHDPIEVYPAGVFRVLAGTTPPRKTTRAGLQARVHLLGEHVELPPAIEMWSHDGIDALGAALTAFQKGRGIAREVRHDGAACDGSAIWLPEAPRG
ncbi:MAG: DUF429 domain-containing protein [Acidimicrobiia bacterium]